MCTFVQLVLNQRDGTDAYCHTRLSSQAPPWGVVEGVIRGGSKDIPSSRPVLRKLQTGGAGIRLILLLQVAARLLCAGQSESMSMSNNGMCCFRIEWLGCSRTRICKPEVIRKRVGSFKRKSLILDRGLKLQDWKWKATYERFSNWGSEGRLTSIGPRTESQSVDSTAAPAILSKQVERTLNAKVSIPFEVSCNRLRASSGFCSFIWFLAPCAGQASSCFSLGS
jgi:hypothetical protein